MVFYKLREIRDDRGFTQIEIANVLNITREAYSMYETGKRQMNQESLCLLADFYQVSADYLLGRKEPLEYYLTDDEKQLMQKYRKLDARGQENARHVIDFEYLRRRHKKRL